MVESNNVGTEPRENGSETGRTGQKTLKPRPKECVTFVTQCVNRRSKQQGTA